MAEYEAANLELSSCWTYVLNRDVTAGDLLTEADFTAQELFTEGATPSLINNKNEILGKRAKYSLAKGSLLQKDSLYEGKEITDDLRYVTVNYAAFPAGLKAGEQVDLRIFFPNGEDYVVLSQKKVEAVDCSEDEGVLAVTFQANEEEILLLASAYVDWKSIADVKLYALRYVSESQKEAVVNYPVNAQVLSLLESDPNRKAALIGIAKTEQRALLESNLQGEAAAEKNEAANQIDREELLELFD